MEVKPKRNTATTFFERFILSPPSMAEMTKVKKLITSHFDYPCQFHNFFMASFQKTHHISGIYLAYRWLISILCFVSVFITATDMGNPTRPLFTRPVVFYLKYLVYLTNLSLILNSVQTLMGAIIITKGVVVYKFRNEFPTGKRPTVGQLVYWKLQELSLISALSVTISFWIIQSPLMKYPMDFSNFLGHGNNSIYAVADWAISGLPYNFSDLWLVLLYAVMYFTFTYIYWVAGGLPRPQPHEDFPKGDILYPKCTDWNHPDASMLCLLVCVSHGSLAHVVICALNLIRVKWMRKVSTEESSMKSKTHQEIGVKMDV